MDVLGSSTEAATFGHGDECLQLLQIEIDVSHASIILKIAIQQNTKFLHHSPT